MSNKTVSFCKYIHWKWSKEDKSHLIKSTRKKAEDSPKKIKSIKRKKIREKCVIIEFHRETQ